MTVALITLASLIAVWYIGAPLWTRSRAAHASNAATTSPARGLLERRDALLRQLKELEFDHSMGKVTAEDYAQSRGAVSSEASAVMNQLERLRGGGSGTAGVAAGAVSWARQLDFEIEIEVLISRARRRLAGVSGAPAGRVSAHHPSSTSSSAGWTCACGRVMAMQDRFCASCGSPRNSATLT